MPLLPRLVIGSALVLLGLALLTVAVLGNRGTLRRNRFVGVRTPATLAAPEAFAAAHRVAAAPLAASGTVGLAAAAVVLTGAPIALTVTVLVLGCVGMLVLAGLCGALGDRAAAAHAGLAPGCAGSCPGCDLVAGCRRPTNATTCPGERPG